MSGIGDFGGSEVAEAFVEIHADTDALAGEVDRAATKAAKEASKDPANKIQFGAEVPTKKLEAAASKAAKEAKDSAIVEFGAKLDGKKLATQARTAAKEAHYAAEVKFKPKILVGDLLTAMREAATAANDRVTVRFKPQVRTSAINKAAREAAKESTATIQFDASFNAGQLQASVKAATLATKPVVEVGTDISASELIAKAKAAARAASDEAEVEFRFNRQGIDAASTDLEAKIAALVADISPVTFDAQVDANELLASTRRAIALAEAEAEIDVRLDRAGFAGARDDLAALRAALQADMEAHPLHPRVEFERNEAAARKAAEALSRAAEKEAIRIKVALDKASLAQAGADAEKGMAALRKILKKKPKVSFDLDNPIEAIHVFDTIFKRLRFFGRYEVPAAGAFGLKAGFSGLGGIATLAGKGIQFMAESVEKLLEAVLGEAPKVFQQLTDAFNELGKSAAETGGKIGKFGGAAAEGLAGFAAKGGGAATFASTFAILYGAASIGGYLLSMAQGIAAVGAAVGSGVVGGITAFAGGITALGVAAATVAIGMQGVPEALKAYNKVQDSIAAGAKPTAKQLKAMADALKGLAPNAQTAVLALSDFGDQWKDVVQQPVQQNLFAGFAPALGEVTRKTLPALGEGLAGIATSVSTLTTEFLGFVSSTKGISAISTILGGLDDVILSIGRGLGSFGGGFLSLFQGSIPFLQQMSDGFQGIGDEFSTWADKVAANGSLTDFLSTAADNAGTLLGIARNLGSAISGWFDQAIGPGTDFLGMIEDLSANFADWTNSVEGQNQIARWMEDARLAVHDTEVVIKALWPIVSAVLANIENAFRTVGGFINYFGDAIIAQGYVLATFVDSINIAAEAIGAFGQVMQNIKDQPLNPDIFRGVTFPSADKIRSDWENIWKDNHFDADAPFSVNPTMSPADQAKAAAEAKRIAADAIPKALPGLTVTQTIQLHRKLVLEAWESSGGRSGMTAVEPGGEFGHGIPVPGLKDPPDVKVNLGVAVKPKVKVEKPVDYQKELEKLFGTGTAGTVAKPKVTVDPSVTVKSNQAKTKANLQKLFGGSAGVARPKLTVAPEVTVRAKAGATKKNLSRLFGATGSTVHPKVVIDPTISVNKGTQAQARARLRAAIAGGPWHYNHATIIDGEWKAAPDTLSEAKERLKSAIAGGPWTYKHAAIIDPSWTAASGTASNAKAAVQSALNGQSWTFHKSATVYVDEKVITKKTKSGSGEIVSGARSRIVGERGPEAIVPLRTGATLDPGVQSLLRQVAASRGMGGVGSATGGDGVTIEVNLPTGDPEAAAMAVMNRMAGRLAT